LIWIKPGSVARQKTVLTGLITLTGCVVRLVAPIRPVHKFPSLTVAESWLPTAISTVAFAAPRIICFQVKP
jgi:hypothetical protein